MSLTSEPFSYRRIVWLDPELLCCEEVRPGTGKRAGITLTSMEGLSPGRNEMLVTSEPFSYRWMVWLNSRAALL